MIWVNPPFRKPPYLKEIWRNKSSVLNNAPRQRPRLRIKNLRLGKLQGPDPASPNNLMDNGVESYILQNCWLGVLENHLVLSEGVCLLPSFFFNNDLWTMKEAHPSISGRFTLTCVNERPYPQIDDLLLFRHLTCIHVLAPWLNCQLQPKSIKVQDGHQDVA